MDKKSIDNFRWITFVILGLTILLGECEETTPEGPTTTPEPPLTWFDCPDQYSYHPHPANCTEYIICVFGKAYLRACEGGLNWNDQLRICDWPNPKTTCQQIDENTAYRPIASPVMTPPPEFSEDQGQNSEDYPETKGKYRGSQSQSRYKPDEEAAKDQLSEFAKKKVVYFDAPKNNPADSDASSDQTDSSNSNQDIIPQGSKRKYSGPEVLPAGQLDGYSGDSNGKPQHMSSWDRGNDDFPQPDSQQNNDDNGPPVPIRKPPPMKGKKPKITAVPQQSSRPAGIPPPWASAMLKRKGPQNGDQPQQASSMDDVDDKPFLASSQQGKYRPMSNQESSGFKASADDLPPPSRPPPRPSKNIPPMNPRRPPPPPPPRRNMNNDDDSSASQNQDTGNQIQPPPRAPPKEYQPPPRRAQRPPPPQKSSSDDDNAQPIRAQTYNPPDSDQNDKPGPNSDNFGIKPGFIPVSRRPPPSGNPAGPSFHGNGNQRRGPTRQNNNENSQKIPAFHRTGTDFDNDGPRKPSFPAPSRIGSSAPQRVNSDDDSGPMPVRNANRIQDRNDNDQGPPSFAIPQRVRPNIPSQTGADFGDSSQQNADSAQQWSSSDDQSPPRNQPPPSSGSRNFGRPMPISSGDDDSSSSLENFTPIKINTAPRSMQRPQNSRKPFVSFQEVHSESSSQNQPSFGAALDELNGDSGNERLDIPKRIWSFGSASAESSPQMPQGPGSFGGFGGGENAGDSAPSDFDERRFKRFFEQPVPPDFDFMRFHRFYNGI